jgi:hypothetical protein
MRALRSYVVRVYRQGARSLVGVVEDTSNGAQRPFESVDQLWALLRQPHLHPARTRASDMGHRTGDEGKDPVHLD